MTPRTASVNDITTRDFHDVRRLTRTSSVGRLRLSAGGQLPATMRRSQLCARGTTRMAPAQAWRGVWPDQSTLNWT